MYTNNKSSLIYNIGANTSIPLQSNNLISSINGKIENSSLFKKLGIDIISSNIKILSPNLKKDNLITSQINANLINSLNNKINLTNTPNNLNQINNLIISSSNKNYLTGNN